MQLLILLIACALMIGSFNIGNILFNFHLPNKTHNIWIYLLQVYDTQAAHAEEVYLVNALHFVARVRWRPQNKFHLLRYTMNINLVTIDWVYGFFLSYRCSHSLGCKAAIYLLLFFDFL